MDHRLHITNGDMAADLIRQSGVGGEVVAWRDVLHQGPVPAGLSLEELSGLRARFIAGNDWGVSFDEVRKAFAERDGALKSFKRAQESTFWFEHDLYDQLQLLQLLHWFVRREVGATRLSLICIGEYPGVSPFRGLGQLTPEQIAGLYEQRQDVRPEQLELGRRAWEAFTADRPLGLQALTGEDLSPLRFLKDALHRHLQEFPSTRDGLGRSERQVFEVLQEGGGTLETVFRRSQIDCEEAPFMGDRPFLYHVDQLAAGDEPLLQFEDREGMPDRDGPPPGADFWERRIRATDAGMRVFRGQADRERFQRIDRWLGGVHLHGERAAWRWAHQRNEIVEQRN